MKKYRLIAGYDGMLNGSIVYATRYHDYGMSSLDTRVTGVEHISVTHKEDGDYPFFTIPKSALEEIKEPTNHEA